MLWNPSHRDLFFSPLFTERALAAPSGRLAMSLEEDEQGLVLQAEVPGFGADEIDLSLVGRRLTLTAERQSGDGEEDASERVHLRRTVTLPFPVERDGLAADLENGLLTVRLPRAAASLPVSIPVSHS